MSIDKWLTKKYIDGKYTCSDFTKDVWFDLTGVDIGPALTGLLEAHDGRGLRREHVRQFRELQRPLDPCLVVMQRPRVAVHLAIYLRGRILQITKRGVEFQTPEIATFFYKSFRYIACNI